MAIEFFKKAYEWGIFASSSYPSIDKYIEQTFDIQGDDPIAMYLATFRGNRDSLYCVDFFSGPERLAESCKAYERLRKNNDLPSLTAISFGLTVHGKRQYNIGGSKILQVDGDLNNPQLRADILNTLKGKINLGVSRPGTGIADTIGYPHENSEFYQQLIYLWHNLLANNGQFIADIPGIDEGYNNLPNFAHIDTSIQIKQTFSKNYPVPILVVSKD